MKNPNTKILLVDDDKTKLLAAKIIIEKKLDIICQTAQNGKEAVLEFKKNPDYNIVILDILMPEMDGFKASANIKNYCTKKNIKLPHIISYTVLEDIKVQEKAVECGITDHISAEDSEELIKVIKKWIMFDNNSFEIY